VLGDLTHGGAAAEVAARARPWGVDVLVNNAGRHLAPSGVTANTVSPGVIVTDGMRRMFEDRAAAEGRPASWAELEP
jgi:NAD(P)-dependent dehydrogenase (short-subunit alcohol dehydrogenase family)